MVRSPGVEPGCPKALSSEPSVSARSTRSAAKVIYDFGEAQCFQKRVGAAASTKKVAGQEGFEPPTIGFGDRCSTVRATDPKRICEAGVDTSASLRIPALRLSLFRLSAYFHECYLVFSAFPDRITILTGSAPTSQRP